MVSEIDTELTELIATHYAIDINPLTGGFDQLLNTFNEMRKDSDL